MNKILVYGITIVCVFFLLSASPVLGNDRAGSKSFQDLTLGLKVLKHQLIQLEPITLEIVLRNTTTEPISAHSGLCLTCDYLELYLGRPGEIRTKISDLSSASSFFLAPEKFIQPGAELRDRIIFEQDLQQNFPDTGTYQLHGILYGKGRKDSRKSVQSKPVTLVIAEPTGIDRLAIKHLNEIYRGKAEEFWNGGTHLNGDSDVADTFFLLFKDSTYAPYVANILAASTHYTDPKKAIEYREFEAGRFDYPWADRALGELFELHQKLGHKTQLEQIVDRLKHEYPHSPYTRPFLDDEKTLNEYLNTLRSRMKKP